MRPVDMSDTPVGDIFNEHSVTLKKLRFQLSRIIHKEFLEELELDGRLERWFDDYVTGLALSLRSQIWAEKVEEVSHTFRTPKTWWEHTKERWFPKWYLKKWPVRYDVTDVRLKRYATFPELKLCKDYEDQPIIWYEAKEIL